MHSNIALIAAFAAVALAAPLSVQGRVGTVQPGQAFAPKQERQLDALTGLLGGGATGTGGATGGAGGAGGLDALVSVGFLSFSLTTSYRKAFEHILILEAQTGLLGGATGTGSAAGASSSGAAGGAGGLDALVCDSLSYHGHSMWEVQT